MVTYHEAMIRGLLWGVAIGAALAGCGGIDANPGGSGAGGAAPVTGHCVAAPPSIGCRSRVTFLCDTAAPAPQTIGCEPTASDTGSATGLEWCCEPQAEVCSDEFAACRSSAQSLTVCIAGDCACMPATHEGENTPVSCRTGEPDGTSYGIAR